VYSAELYDPDTGTWTAIANTRSGGPCRAGCPRVGGMATLLQDGTLLFMRLSSSEPIIEFVEIYDPATGTWTPTGDMARPDAQYGTATQLLDGTGLVAGGSNGPDVDGLAEVYDPATGSWTETGNMLYDSPSATLLLDGTVLVAGGFVCQPGSGGSRHWARRSCTSLPASRRPTWDPSRVRSRPRVRSRVRSRPPASNPRPGLP
jgi:hypothetical protein